MFPAPLLERGKKHVYLTPLGETVLQKARAVLLSVSELEDLAQMAGTALAGRLRLGVIPTIAPYLLPRMIGTLSQHFPGLDLTLREAVTERLIADLQRGHLDLAVLALPVAEPDLTEFSLFEEEFVLVRPAHEADAPVPEPSELREMRLLLLEEGHCFRDQALSFCEAGRGKPREIMEGSSMTTLVQMVSAGLGVTLIPEMAIAQETGAGDVAIARFPAPMPRRRIGLVWRKTSPISESLEEIGGRLKQMSPSG